MKTIYFLIFACCFSIGYSQKNNSGVYNQQDLSNYNDSERVILSHDNSIKGESYLYGAWNKGMLVMQDTLFFAQNFLRYDAYNDRILVNDNDYDEEAFEVSDYNLTGFSIVESKTNSKHDFVKLATTDFVDHTVTGFFEVVTNPNGTNYLLKKTVKYIYDPNKSKGVAIQNNLQSEFKERTKYYLKNDAGLYVEVRLKKKDILAILNNNPSKLESYIEANDIHFNKDEEVAALADYYYSLQ